MADHPFPTGETNARAPSRSPFAYSADNKRYHTLAYYHRHTFPAYSKVYKAALDAGFTCPNIDGRCASGGCVFCDGGNGAFTSGEMDISSQMAREIARIGKKTPNAGIIAYFQAHTNTYAPLSILKRCYETALGADERVCALAVATRADALEEEIFPYLSELSRRTHLTIELGLQSVRDDTARRINRGHDYAAFLAAYRKLKAAGIRVCVHLINGLAGESAADMIESARTVGRLRPDGIKLHMLHVLEGTVLAEQYRRGALPLLSREAYVDIVTRQLELLPPATVIERLTGDGDKRKLLAPDWSRDKIRTLALIDRTLAARDTWQGKYFDARR